MCMSNTKQLMLAWILYPSDNDDKLVNNFGVAETQQEVYGNKQYRNWVNNVMDWGTDAMNTNVAWVRNGLLSPYLSGNLGVYHCPADSFASPPQRTLGWSGRARSFSMNCCFGPFNPNPHDTWATGRNELIPNYRQWLKLSQVPRPADFFVILDEHPDSINDGYFINNPDNNPASGWGDAPGSSHGGAGDLSYADGHSEIHKWKSARTKFPVRYNSDRGSWPSLDPLGQQDFRWLSDRMAIRY
jgi:hypothetical protein